MSAFCCIYSKSFAIKDNNLRTMWEKESIKSRKENPRKRPRAPPNSLIKESSG